MLKLDNVLMNLSLDSGFQRNLVKQYREDASVLGGPFGVLVLYMMSRLLQDNLRVIGQ